MKRILISTGESSGDLHAASLIHAVNALNPDCEFTGVGGDHMRQAGAKIIVDVKTLSVMGVIEPLIHLREIKHAFDTVKKTLRESRPDLFIMIDAPGINLRLAKYAHKLGIKTLYYISPQVWAWHQSRVKTIKRVIDCMAVIFPFEVDFYRRFDVPAKYVGHPLTRKVKPSLTATEIKQKYALTDANPIIGLVAGSRHNEIKYILPTVLQSAELIAKKYPDTNFVLPIASTLPIEKIQSELLKYPINITVVHNDLYNVISVCDAVIAVSGTVTLEIALLGVPMVIIYKTAWLTYVLGRLLIKVKSIGICNLIAGKNIVPELIQHDASPENIFKAMNRFITDKTHNDQTREQLAALKAHMLAEKHTHAIGNVVLEMLA